MGLRFAVLLVVSTCSLESVPPFGLQGLRRRHSGKIALAKPYLSDKITDELLKVEKISTTPHLTEECKKVIAQAAIKSFNTFFDQIKQKDKVISFVESHLNSSRIALRKEAEKFIKR